MIPYLTYNYDEIVEMVDLRYSQKRQDLQQDFDDILLCTIFPIIPKQQLDKAEILRKRGFILPAVLPHSKENFLRESL